MIDIIAIYDLRFPSIWDKNIKIKSYIQNFT